MKIQTILFVIATYSTDLVFSRNPLDGFHILKDITLNLVGRSISEPGWHRRAESINHIQKRIPKSVQFPCADPDDEPSSGNPFSKKPLPSLAKFRSKTRPTSVHALMPGDIDVVGAMGDSLTAANGAGASNLFQVFTENRGVSWSIGGDGTWREYFTVPNVLKEFNPNLVGYSLGDSFGFHRAAQFNAAEPGAMTADLPYMAKQLVKRIKSDPRVDIKNDWKLITLLIGANDFCLESCFTDTEQFLEKHKRMLITALMTIKNNLPRTLVNLVPAPDVEILTKFTNKPPICKWAHMMECPCFFGEPNKRIRPLLRKMVKKWIEWDMQVDNLPEFNDSEDFAIVIQPFIVNVSFPVDSYGYTDYTHLSTDCFHFSQKGYARAANAIWNNMMEPVGNKSTNWGTLYEKFLCPTEQHPYIYTNKNSNRAVQEESNDFESNLLIKRSVSNRDQT